MSKVKNNSSFPRSYFLGCFLLGQVVNFFDDIQKRFGSAGFVGDCFGCFMSWPDEIAVISTADEE